MTTACEENIHSSESPGAPTELWQRSYWPLPGIRGLNRGTASSGIPTTTTLVEVGISPNDMESKLDSLPPPQICKVNTV